MKKSIRTRFDGRISDHINKILTENILMDYKLKKMLTLKRHK